MRYKMVRPHAGLREYVQYYCYMESEGREPDVLERVIPTANVQLMFHYGNPFAVRLPDESEYIQPSSIVSGLTDSFSDVSTNGETGVVFIVFQPAGACHFLRFPLSELENRSLDMGDVFGNEIREVEERLVSTQAVCDRTEVIDRYLLGKLREIPEYDDSLVREGVRLAKLIGGAVTVRRLSQRLSTTEKNLERKFSRYIGISPKRFLQVVRFEGIMAALYRKRSVNLTEIALNCGYYDQAHFIKEFKRFTGYTPGNFIAKYPVCGNEVAGFR